jgi:hypothetical protein
MNKKDVETVEPESAESGFVSELKWIGDCITAINDNFIATTTISPSFPLSRFFLLLP